MEIISFFYSYFDKSAIIIIPLIVGYILDLIFGDPQWLPHPVVAYGNIIKYAEKALNTGKNRRIKGALLATIITTSFFIVFYLICFWLKSYNDLIYIAFASYFVFSGIANKCLLKEGQKVLSELESKGLAAGRKRLSWIVGRDTSNLNEKQVKTAVFETVAENLSDGVVAPLFWYLIAGIPGLMTYKLINTLDSMIGYKTPRYNEFGYFSAKIDDIVNYVPARLTAFLMVLITMSSKGMVFVIKYAKKHSSPNAGFPEAALAGILDCRFGGPNIYHGKLFDKPYIGENPRDIDSKEYTKIKYINHGTTFLMLILICLTVPLINLYIL